MKRFFSIKPSLSILLLSIACLWNNTLNAQNNKQVTFGDAKKEYISAEQYDLRKASGQLDPKVEYVVNTPVKSGVVKPAKPKSGAKSSRDLTAPPCDYVPTDNFQDPWGGDVYFDDSPPAGPFEVQIPFTFCFYDQLYTSFFINNNGNITFDAQYTTFTSSGFPSATVPPMIAPFWADVYTTGGLGQVRFEVYQNYAIVSWDTVGVFPGEDPSQRNAFQLIITDGVSPVLPPQTNICFIFGDMQWTTGTASQGTGGFGGTPATVGVNRGDGVDYIQLGRFDAPGTAYDGPFDNNDGVDFLDNSIFFFNTCLSSGQNNIAPLSLGAPICDTLVVCTGGTVPINFFFIPVEPGQEVDAGVLTPDLSGLLIDTIIAGAQCEVVATFTGTIDNQGFNTISFLATDNGTPAADYQLDIVVQVLPSNFTPVITGTPAICSGESTTLSVEGGPYEQYLWAPNFDQTPTTQITESSSVTVTVAGNGQCGVSEPFDVIVAENPTPLIAGQDSVCNDGTTTLYTTQAYDQYSWSTASSNDSITATPGQYLVTVIDANGCEGISSLFTVVSVTSIVPQISGDSIICFDESAQITTSNYSTFQWTNITTTPPTVVGSTQSLLTGPGTYVVFITDTVLGCDGTSLPFSINQYEPSATLTGIEPYCNDTSITINETSDFAFYSWFYQGVEISDSSSVIWSGSNGTDNLILTITDIHGCSEDSVIIAQPTLQPSANYSTDPLVPETLENTTISFTDESVPAANDPVVEWLWTFDPPNTSSTQQNPSQAFNTNDSVTVTLIVTSELGCRDTITASITAPFVPNAFSPNGDNKNDFFKVPFITNLKENNVVVFNRWGKKVFEADNYDNSWGGDNLPSGTYFYVVSAPNFKTMQGTVSIFRE
jgi:gliding motility-associated-like protein